MKPKFSFSYWLLALLAFALIAVGFLADQDNNEHYIANSRVEAANQLMTVHSKLEANLLSDIHSVKGLVSLIAAFPEINQNEFQQAVKPLFDEGSNLRNIGAAPDMVIRMMFPLSGNEKALGLDYRKVPEQWEMADLARTTGQIVLAGPLQLVQGGTGLITRFPVYTDGYGNKNSFWGLVSAVIDTDKLFLASGLEPSSPLEISIRHLQEGQAGEVFFGNPALFQQDPVLINLELPNAVWQLAGQPRHGWPVAASNKLSFRLILLLIGLLIFIPCYMLIRTANRLIDTKGQLDTEKARLLRTIESTPNVAVQWYDDKGRIIYWNHASEEIFGWTAEEAMGKELNQLIFNDKQAADFKKLLTSMKQFDTPEVFDIEVVHKDGSKRIIHSSTFSISNSNESLFVCMDVDITEQRLAEEALQTSHKKYQNLVDDIGEQFVVYSHDTITGKLHYVSDGIKAVTGLSRNDVLGKNWAEVIQWTPGSLERATDAVYRLATGVTVSERIEMHFTHPEGDIRTILVSSHLSQDERGNQSIDGIVENITARKQAERDLRESESKLRGLYELSPLGIALTDMSGKYIEFNSAFARICGYTADELHQLDYWELTPRKYMKAEAKQLESLAQHGSYGPYEKEYIQKDGTLIPIQLSGLLIDGPDDQKYIWSIVEDISERKATEDVLRLAATAFETQEAITITDVQGNIISVNSAFTKITGYSADEVIGKRPNILSSGTHDIHFYEAMWKSLINEGVWSGEVVNRRKNGQVFPEQLSITASRNADGQITNYIGVFSDISEKKEIENQLRQAQKMEAIGTLVGGIAHEFNNMLVGISGNIFLARELADKGSESAPMLDTAEEICFKAADMISQLLIFSRQDQATLKLSPIEMKQWLNEGIRLSHTSLKGRIKLELDICQEPAELTVMADKTQLQQILLNLLNNARDASEHRESPVIKIDLSSGKASAEFRKKHPGFKGYDYVRLMVHDNGSGIPADKLNKIFEPFYTTKEVGKGTGLGMSVIQGIVDSLHGAIEVESEWGKGTTFTIYIPRTKETSAQASAHKKERVIQLGHGETILIADDEPEVLNMTSAILEGLGYKVMKAEDGQDALEQFESSWKSIDMLLLDVIMPRLSGPEAAVKMRKICPDVPVAFYTGYSREELEKDLGGLTHYKLLSKPFQVADLSNLVKMLVTK